MADLPPRLSDRQQFVLGQLVSAEQSHDERCRRRYRELWEKGYPHLASHQLERIGLFVMKADALSRAVAREFGGLEFDPASLPKGERRRQLRECQRRELEDAEDDDERAELRRRHAAVNDLLERSPGLPPQVKVHEETLTEAHISTHSESLRRLEDRGLIERYNERFGNSIPARARESTNTTHVYLTDEGREAGRAILRRHSDGRYSLSFDTLD